MGDFSVGAENKRLCPELEVNMGKFLQINLNHCRGAQDILLNQVGAWGVDVVMISEPYAVSKRGESRDGSWFGSEDEAAAILFSNSVRTPRHRELSRGEGFVLVRWGNAVLVSAYALPNRPVDQFENFLHALAREIDRFGGGGPVPLSSAATSTRNTFRGRDTRTTRAAYSSRSGSFRVISPCVTRGKRKLACKPPAGPRFISRFLLSRPRRGSPAGSYFPISSL